MSRDDPEAFPLFKGATRLPMVAGVPLVPLVLAFGVVASLGMLLSLWCYGLILPVWAGMRLIIKEDDRAFHVWALWFETTCRNKNKAFWAASTYTVSPPRKRR